MTPRTPTDASPLPTQRSGSQARHPPHKVAFVVLAYLGTQRVPEGRDSQKRILNALGRRCDLTVYSFSTPPASHEPFSFSVKHPPAWVTFFPARLACFACMLLRDHLIHRFEIVHIKASRHIAFAAALVSKPFRSKIIFSPGNIERSHRRRFRPEARSRSASNECTKLAARLADCLNTMTQIQAAGYAPYVSPTTTVAIIPNGIDSGLFTKNTLALDEPYTFLHVGIQYRTKNQQMLLDCFARISRHVRCKLYVVGADLLHGRLEAHAAALGIASDVTFTGHVPYHELPAYYQKAHVFLLTSFFESQALVINEAMASGVVVCGTKVGLIADLSPDLCIGIESFDPDVLADAVLQLIHDRARYADMRDRAYAWATHHDLSWTVEQYLALYDRLLQG